MMASHLKHSLILKYYESMSDYYLMFINILAQQIKHYTADVSMMYLEVTQTCLNSTLKTAHKLHVYPILH